MLFRIIQKRDRTEVSNQIVDDIAAATAIENWSSRFTDKPRTKYGMKITTQYVRDLLLNEVGRFPQPNEQFIIERIA